MRVVVQGARCVGVGLVMKPSGVGEPSVGVGLTAVSFWTRSEKIMSWGWRLSEVVVEAKAVGVGVESASRVTLTMVSQGSSL